MTFAGILPALVTPLDENEQFVVKNFELLLERVYAAGAHGVYVSGQTGEGLMQPLAARQQLIEAAVRNSPKDKIVIAHVGAYRTPEAICLARFASKVGVHAVSSLPPIGLYSFQEIKQYYIDLAAASEAPLLLYYFPAFSRAIVSLESQRELLTIPNVIGLKFSDFNLHGLWKLKQESEVVFNGHDEVLAAGLLMGADGGIGSFYNLVPELFVELYDRARSGDWAAARATQDRINELIEITLRFPMLPAIKTMLGWSGIPCGPCCAPRRSLTAAEEARLAELLHNSSFAARCCPDSRRRFKCPS